MSLGKGIKGPWKDSDPLTAFAPGVIVCPAHDCSLPAGDTPNSGEGQANTPGTLGKAPTRNTLDA